MKNILTFNTRQDYENYLSLHGAESIYVARIKSPKEIIYNEKITEYDITLFDNGPSTCTISIYDNDVLVATISSTGGVTSLTLDPDKNYTGIATFSDGSPSTIFNFSYFLTNKNAYVELDESTEKLRKVLDIDYYLIAMTPLDCDFTVDTIQRSTNDLTANMFGIREVPIDYLDAAYVLGNQYNFSYINLELKNFAVNNNKPYYLSIYKDNDFHIKINDTSTDTEFIGNYVFDDHYDEFRELMIDYYSSSPTCRVGYVNPEDIFENVTINDSDSNYYHKVYACSFSSILVPYSDSELNVRPYQETATL